MRLIFFSNYQKIIISFILSIASVIFISCASTVRYTAKENSNSKSIGSNKNSNLNEIYTANEALETNIEIASYYADEFNGKRTANGETYDMYDYTAAHINFPFDTIVRVTNLSNDKSVIVRINDRKPDTNGRAIDLSLKAAHELRMISSGITKVKIEVLEWGSK